MDIDKRLISVVPSERQIRFQQLEFYAFIHFTVNTFTDREWGDGTESPDIFDPVNLDAEQWVQAVISAGMKGSYLPVSIMTDFVCGIQNIPIIMLCIVLTERI